MEGSLQVSVNQDVFTHFNFKLSASCNTKVTLLNLRPIKLKISRFNETTVVLSALI